MATPTTSVKLKNKMGVDITYSGASEIQVVDGNGNTVVFSYANFAGITATQNDVMSGKYFLNSNKELVVGTKTLKQLNAPTVTINGSVLSLTDGDNGNFSEKYYIYVDGTYKTQINISNTTYDLSSLSSIDSGTHTVMVKVVGDNMGDSTGVSVQYSKPLVAPSISTNNSILQMQSNDDHTQSYEITIDGTTTINVDTTGYVAPAQNGSTLNLTNTVYSASASNGTLSIT